MTSALSPLSLPPLSLYVHFPWCVSKCPYCDFNSHAAPAELPAARYLGALRADLAAQAAMIRGREIVSVFMGGGTPSLFSPGQIGSVLEFIRHTLACTPEMEVTLEANPGTIERGRFAEYRAAGVNRVSLGAQTFDAARLGVLGRIHSPDDTRTAAAELHAAGLENFNLDLMYALPEQTTADALADLDAALELDPQHLSHYQLTLEPGTVFAARPPVLPGDEASHEMLSSCRERLAERGFERYEVSGYARPGRQAFHNLNYWTFGDYLGIGAGAHGKRSAIGDSGLQVIRTAHLREPRRYMASASDPLPGKTVPARDLPFEFMMNALRLVDGFAPGEFESRTGLPFAAIAGTLAGLQARGLVASGAERVRPSPRGLEFLNDVLLAFLPESQAGTGS